MAICAVCGAASADGALGCASCGRPPVPPPPSGAPSVPPVPPAAPQAGPAHPPPAVPAPPVAPPMATPTALPAVGSWGAGRPYDPAAGQPAALRRLTGQDWRPALRVAVAPTAVLLLAALIAAVPDGYDLPFADSPGFGDRFGSAVAMALAALGAPFRLGLTGRLFGPGGTDFQVRAVPMTVTVLWLLALWLGLRSGSRLRQARTGAQTTRAQAAGEAARTAVVLAAVTLVTGLLGGADWSPAADGRGADWASYARGVEYSSDSGWLEAVGWSALLGGLLAFAVYGTDALRWAAWRNRTVRGWAVAGLAAGRAAAVSVGLAALVALLLIATEDDGLSTGVAVAFLPNLGLMLLGLGSGATARTSYGAGYGEGYGDGPDSAAFGRGARSGDEFSLFDLHGETADWRWALLLAVVAAAYLGWTAHRRGLDAADRIRLAVVSAVGLTLLMAVAGLLVTGTSGSQGGGWSSSVQVDRTFSVGLVFGTQLVANAVWAAIGALAVPPLLAAVLRVRSGGPSVAVPPEPGPDGSAAFGAGAPAPGDAAAASVPAQGAGPLVSDVVGSGEEAPSAGATPSQAGDGAAADPSVWRKEP
ncbi:hypothetical protein OH807_16870 [Kitasatospora sp. NBC_01560]|uniref:hypothetical protein n=1 Tax=Kitasatospora sp. NBC_01560 TaxID=2975965 RepID=UPI00386E5EE9